MYGRHIRMRERKRRSRITIFGTWYIEKVAVISEMYTGTTKDGVAEEDLYDSEDLSDMSWSILQIISG